MANSLSGDGLMLSGEVIVTTSGTEVPIKADNTEGGEFWEAIQIIAKIGNTLNIFIGGEDVATTTNDGIVPGEGIEFDRRGRSPKFDLTKMFIDAGTSGDGIDFYAVK